MPSVSSSKAFIIKKQNGARQSFRACHWTPSSRSKTFVVEKEHLPHLKDISKSMCGHEMFLYFKKDKLALKD